MRRPQLVVETAVFAEFEPPVVSWHGHRLRPVSYGALIMPVFLGDLLVAQTLEALLAPTLLVLDLEADRAGCLARLHLWPLRHGRGSRSALVVAGRIGERLREEGMEVVIAGHSARGEGGVSNCGLCESVVRREARIRAWEAVAQSCLTT